jgi:DNA invertase Pin-like site-specific DNA recombinase
LFSEVTAVYFKEHVRVLRTNAQIQAEFSRFLALLGVDRPIGDITKADLRRYAESRGLVVYKEYSDEWVSGAKEKRPSLDRLMDDARKRRFDLVGVWRFDRFARSTKHLVTALEEFQHLKIDFVSFNENVDTSSPMGKVMFSIIGAMAEFEQAILRERVTAGVRQAISKRKSWGRRPVEALDPTITTTVLRLQKQGSGCHRIG